MNTQTQPQPTTRQPLTLAALDAMPAAPLPGGGALLAGCTIPQLETIHDKLARLEGLHDKMSGACATMRGLVLLEVKAKLEHGQFKPWIAERFGKSYRRAAEYMRLAKQFTEDMRAGAARGKSGKSAELRTFELIAQNASGLLTEIEAGALDLENPAVQAVVQWSEGKSAHQLMLDLPEGTRGGNKYERGGEKGARKTLSPEAAAELLRGLCTGAAEQLHAIHEQHAFSVLTPAELDGLIDHAEAVALAAKAWRSMPKAQRDAKLAELLKA
jgi:hypothetical protein